jgi:RHS repeat-associated protein
MLLNARRRGNLLRGRVAVGAATVVVVSSMAGSGGVPAPQVQPQPAALVLGCSAGDTAADPAADPGTAAAAKPRLSAAGAAFQARVAPGAATAKPTTVAYAGAKLVFGPKAAAEPVTVGITPLAGTDLPELDPGMTNLTEGQGGYQFTPHPYEFTEPIQVSLPYDPAQAAAVPSLQDVFTFFFDEQASCWRPLKRLAVDEQQHVIVSETSHFTDMINAAVTVPDTPQGASFDPNMIKGIQAGDPGSQVSQIAAPGPSSTGEARLSYPIQVPPGRLGMQPNLGISYNSSGADSWLGLGWDMAIPSITVNTQFGVPRYSGGLETESYLMGGQQLTPVAHRTQFQPREAEKVFHGRVEGEFERIVRHGDSPGSYSWEVTDKDGTRYLYGGTPDSTLTDGAGHTYQWALREVRDLHGNFMRYHSVQQSDVGSPGGTVPGRALYPKTITYTGTGDTEGPFSITFVRDRELGEPRRPDVGIDARGGFKYVTADLLRRVEVRFNGTMVRSYDLAYSTGAYGKSLLRSVAQFGEDGKRFTTQTFDYFDDVRDGAGAYQAFGTVDWTSPNDNVRNGTVAAVGGNAGAISALGGNTSTSVGGHLYIGFGVSSSKSGSVGVKAGFSDAESSGLLALIDVDGDNLPDKVFRAGGGVAYRKNLSTPNGQPRFSDTVVPLRNLPGILAESSSTLTVGVEAYLGGAAAQLNNVDTVTTTDRYFTDVNGDGITDLVDGNSVLFGRVGPDGSPAYGLSGDSPVPVTTAPVDAGAVLGVDNATRERQIDSHPLVDSVRRWVAPFDGTVRVTGSVALVQDTSQQRATYTKADGVRVTIQRENAELFSLPIAATDYTAHTPDGVDAIAVHRGDRLYFRVQSGFDGAFDEVAWDPAVSYVDAPNTPDVNGLDPYRYRASNDFTLGGRAATVVVPVTGTIHLSGALTKPAATTDDVTAVVTRDGQTVFSQTLPAGQTGDIPVDADIQVQQGQQLQWRIHVDSPIDLGPLSWTPLAEYTSAEGVPRLTDENGNAILSVRPPYTVDMYPADQLSAPQQFFVAPATGTLVVAPVFTVDPQAANGRVVFTVKSPGALLAKREIAISNGQAAPVEPFAVPVQEGQRLYFDYSTLDPELAAHVTTQSTQVGPDADTLGPAPSALHSAALEGAFPQPYRGWAAIGYNGNRARAAAPIAQGDLVVDEHTRDQLPTSVDPQRDRDAFAADPKITPPKFVQFAPTPANRRWGSGEEIFVTSTGARSSRLGGAAVNVPVAADLAQVTGVPRVSHSNQISLTGSIGDPDIGSVGGSIATGDSDAELDYLDLNGDRFPDVVGSRGVQYTDPTGRLGGTRASIPDGAVRSSHTRSGNAGAGSAARTIPTGRGNAAPTGTTSGSTSSAGNDLPPLGIAGSHGTGAATTSFDLLDINGDGLPDRVYADGRAALNLGYSFAAPETWPGGPLNDGRSTTNGVNLGFNTDFYGFAGGASFSAQSSSSKASLVDVNGDELPDRVSGGSPMLVALNTGSGFAAPVPFLGGLSGLTADGNATLGAGVYFRFSFCFLIFTGGCIVINPGADTSTGASRSEQAIRDINGDGFADQLRSNQDGELVVAANRTGRTNLLKSVRRPLGSRIDLDYTRDGNTYDQPDSRYVLTKVTVDDGHPGDGQDVQLSTYRYSGGVYDRLERQFRGYGTVVAETRNPADGALFRSSTSNYRTDSYYTAGLLARQLTADGAGRPFTETLNTHDLSNVDDPTAAADPASTTGTIFPRLIRSEHRFYEGQQSPVKSTHSDLSYDPVGNMIRILDAGEPGTADDVETKIRYSVESGFCQDFYLIGAPQTIQVRGAGVLLRQRENTIECRTGDLTRNRVLLADGTGIVTDFTHFDEGNIESVTYPPNARNQRYRVDYTYDPTLKTYPATITDIFGLHSSSTYNLKYGAVETTTDENGQVLRQTYDNVGRLATVISPRESGDNKPTIAFEYHPEATVPYAVTRHADRDATGRLRSDTIDTVTFVDGLGRAIQTKRDSTIATAPGANAADVMSVSGRVSYDFVGRAVEQTFPTTEPKGAANTTFATAVDTVTPTRMSYDVLDRRLRTTLPDGTSASNAYGFGSDKAGTAQFQTTATDANGNVRDVFADVRTHITAVRTANPAGNQPVIWTSYDYNAIGEITRITDDRGNQTTAAYDNVGRRTVLTSPDSGRTETVYDRADNPIKQITANLAATASATQYTYDFNRLTSVSYPKFPANNVTYTYGAPGAADNGAGRVVSTTDAAGSVGREYDALGAVSQETRTVRGVLSRDTAYTTKYTYDSFNRMLQMTYPDGEVLSYGYDSGGMVNKATGVKSGRSYPYLKRLDYDKFGQELFQEDGNGTKTSHTYGAADRRLATLKATLPHGETFQNLSYTYDPAGNITATGNAVEVPRLGGLELGGPSTQTFSYDGLNRLTSSQGQFQPSRDKTDTYQLSMAYDSLDNVTSKVQQHAINDDHDASAVQALTLTASSPPAGNLNYSYAYTGGPHAPTTVGPLQLHYDADGNLVSRTDTGPGGKRRQQVWDEDNRLACTGETAPTAPDVAQTPAGCGQLGRDKVRYLYDSKGTRIVKDAGSGKVNVYPSQTFSQRGGAAFKHIFIGSVRLVSKMVEPDFFTERNQFYFHTDHLGSTGYGTDANGRLVDHQQYFPSGETWVDETNSDPTPYQFTGKELDPETGLYYYGARYYDPTTQLWQSPDPMLDSYVGGGGNGGVYNPTNLAAYTYAYNNPVRMSDADGRIAWDQVWNRAAGFARIVGGGFEVVGGVTFGTVTLPTVAGGVAGALVATHGVDTMYAGARQVISGQWERTQTSVIMESAGLTESQAEMTDAIGGLVFTAATSAPSATVRAFIADEAGAVRFAKPSQVELTPYNVGGGHHIPAKNSLVGAPGYEGGTALAISKGELATYGLYHPSITGAQRALYTEFGATNKVLTWDEVRRIETQALLRAAGANTANASSAAKLTPELAADVVERALAPQIAAGRTPTRIPWVRDQ